MMIYHLELPEPPSTNRYWRTVYHGRAPRTYISGEGVAFKQQVATLCFGLELLQGPLAVGFIHFFRRDRDLDNNLKALFDVLQGAAYFNDSQIERVYAAKVCAKQAGRQAGGEVWVGGVRDLPMIIEKVETGVAGND